MSTPGSLARPSGIALSRVSDRLTFLYLDLCRIEQDDNGTHARIESEEGEVKTTYFPSASLSCLMLGPGTSISAPAAAALARNGCAVVFTGAGAVRGYSAWSPLSGSTKLLNAQAQASVDPTTRVRVASRMLRQRFPELIVPETRADGTPVSLETLRGLEGARMKGVYRQEAQRRRLTGWRRRSSDYDGNGPLDPVNEALNYANTSLYGLALSVVCALGMSPGLGIIHEGNPRAFVLDIADLYKSEFTIPLAFKQARSSNPGRDVMVALRKEFKLLRLLPRMVSDIHALLQIDDPEPEWDLNIIRLWSEGDTVGGGWNRHERDVIDL